MLRIWGFGGRTQVDRMARSYVRLAAFYIIMDLAFGSLPLQSHQLNACTQTGEYRKMIMRGIGASQRAFKWRSLKKYSVVNPYSSSKS